MAAAPILSGELGLLSLFDLGQLLMLNGATGGLIIHRDGRKSYLYFDRGQIVDALDDSYRAGEQGAYRIFTYKDGRFEFRTDVTASSPAIHEGTEGLMMEAARLMDEAGQAAGETDKVVDKLARRSNALDALREAFQLVASQAGSLPEAGESPFALLKEASDALLFRPGHAPRLLQGGRWRSAGRQVLDAAAFDQLRTRLFDGVWNASLSSAASVATCVITGEDQRRYTLTRVSGAHEALWVRSAEMSPPETGLLEGELSHLRALLHAPAGLVLVGGPDAESADRMLHACVALLARERGGTVVLCADHGRWRHRDEAGAVLRASATDAAELLRTLAPDVVAYDTAGAAGSLAAMHTAPLVLAAIVTPEAGALLPRWCERVGRHWGDGIEALCATTLVGLVQSSRPGANGRQSFRAQRCAREGEIQIAVAPPSPVAESTPSAVAAAVAAAVASPVAAAAASAAPASAPSPAADTPAPPAATETHSAAASAIAEAMAHATAEDAPPPVTAEEGGEAPDAPRPEIDPNDPFAALADELTRTLRKAA